ncbi:glycosyltransferase family 2 protein [Sediminicola luteus]|uniref:Glycosyl transferase n=1 Tax=Sediminicola luteus TaxID=319238 RepID=A0A2A4G3N2_9FLAO|nr:glycosyltransferase family 2 protein [Sediminicola luteus]PCE62598.1 glycosyl transferase [Sediminicola luteus]
MKENQNSNPLVSIVTGTYNSASFIADCVSSINTQDYPKIEHIIIDGLSKDNTIQIIKNTPNRVTKIISEPDDGIYDAMNKGLKLAKGNIIGILNSDDFYNDSKVLSMVAKTFEETGADCVFGDLYYVTAENTDKIVRKWVTGNYYPNAFRKGWHPAHPSFFVKREVYEKYGYFDTELRLAADFELMLRFLEIHQLKPAYIPFPMVRMRLGGATSKNLTNIINGNKECIEAFRKNGVRPPMAYPIVRLVPKLKQYFS